MRTLQPRSRKERPPNKSDKIPAISSRRQPKQGRRRTGTAEFPNRTVFTVFAEVVVQSLARLNSHNRLHSRRIIFIQIRAFILLKKPSQKKRSDR